MRAFSLFVTDARYSVPTLVLLLVDNEAQAIERAKAKLRESIFHNAVELYERESVIYQRTTADELYSLD